MEITYRIAISELHKAIKKYDKDISISGNLNFNNGGMHETKIVSVPFVYSESKKKLILDRELEVELTTTPCNYGGFRYWFLCPHCGNNKTVLLYDGNALACRSCSGTDHTSLNRTKTDSFYYFEQAKKVAQKIDNNFEWNGWIGNGIFPDRPKNMHYKTYWQLWRKFENYWSKGTDAFFGKVSRMSKMR